VRVLGLEEVEGFGEYKGQQIALRGVLPQSEMLELFVERVMRNIHSEPRVFEGGNHMVDKVAVCSGGAPELVEEAIAAGCDLFLTGEAAEYTPAMAAEGKIHIVAAGHHATEIFGVRALAEELGKHFDGCEAEFIDIPNAL
jgi:putative NIF3 family GTP cyclohydrolase 1 type 2